MRRGGHPRMCVWRNRRRGLAQTESRGSRFHAGGWVGQATRIDPERHPSGRMRYDLGAIDLGNATA